MEIKDIKTKYELAVYMADRMVDGHDSEVCANIAFQWHKEQVKLFDIPDVVGQSEQFFCCKEQINQRCSEQCLGCFQFKNKDGMNKTIWKYELKIDDLQNVIMPVGAEILSVQMQNETPCLWALVNPDEKDTDARYIETFGTGHPVAYDMGGTREFIGTYQTRGLVFHVFEYTGV
jgi:hypothetical protein